MKITIVINCEGFAFQGTQRIFIDEVRHVLNRSWHLMWDADINPESGETCIPNAILRGSDNKVVGTLVVDPIYTPED